MARSKKPRPARLGDIVVFRTPLATPGPIEHAAIVTRVITESIWRAEKGDALQRAADMRRQALLSRGADVEAAKISDPAFLPYDAVDLTIFRADGRVEARQNINHRASTPDGEAWDDWRHPDEEF